MRIKYRVLAVFPALAIKGAHDLVGAAFAAIRKSRPAKTLGITIPPSILLHTNEVTP